MPEPIDTRKLSRPWGAKASSEIENVITSFRGIPANSRFCVAPLFLFYLVTQPIAVLSRLFANVLNEE
jgi:hypothetical protein